MREAIERFAKEMINQAEDAVKRGKEEKGLLAKAVLLGRSQAFDFVLKELNGVLLSEISKQQRVDSLKEVLNTEADNTRIITGDE